MVGLWHTVKIKKLKENRSIKIIKNDKEFFFNNLYKIGYSKKITKGSTKEKHLKFIVKAFQRRYRQELVNGKIDKECLIITNNLLKN